MSLQHAIITALLEKPSSGLELTRRFDRSIGYFWPATHQQIYRELARLERAGWIRTLPGEPGRGGRKEYEVLPEGRAALVEWVAAEADPKPIRDALVLRLRAAAVVGLNGVDEQLRRHRLLHRQRLSEYLDIEESDFPEEGEEDAASGDRLRHLVLRAGIKLESFWLEWIDETLAELERERDRQDP
ncbi:PadR family transcriptional regulator [Actinopolyspora mortivallis]|uniref:PadR family transcriptional regulator n=1 Tax=Actinopolyspora mortivallis TaxID=33906 RepID=UPI00036E799A|nr:PadR family transcriptional regulator [Actinopolyspora mortivallis]